MVIEMRLHRGGVRRLKIGCGCHGDRLLRRDDQLCIAALHDRTVNAGVDIPLAGAG